MAQYTFRGPLDFLTFMDLVVFNKDVLITGTF